MEIILKQDVDNLGNKDQIVNVRPGYANNYLIPQGYATAATPSAKKVLAEKIKQQAHKEAKMVADAQAVADKLGPVQNEQARLLADKEYLNTVLKEGAARAYKVASGTLSKVYRKIGFYQL